MAALRQEVAPSLQQDPFTAVASLGGVCQVAYQIERSFGFRVNGPFDWLVTPLESIAKVFADGGERFGAAVSVILDGETALCHHYGVAYQHEFARNGDHKVVITPEALAKTRSKLMSKFSRWKARMAREKNVLFIRLGGHHDSAFPSPDVMDPRPLTTADVNGLCATLEAEFPSLRFTLAVVTLGHYTTADIDSTTLDPRVRLFVLPAEGVNLDDNENPWKGCSASWAPIFDQFTFNMGSGEGEAKQYVGAVDVEHLHG